MVSDTVNHAMDCVSAGIKNGGWYRDPKTGQPLYGDKKNTGSRSGNKLMRILKKGSSKTNPKDLIG